MKSTFTLSWVTALSMLVACNNPAATPTQVEGASPTPEASTTPGAEPPVPSPTPSATAEVGFRDDFDGDAIDAEKWNAFEQTGLIAVRHGAVEILNAGIQPDFPYLLTRRDIIPPGGPFFFEVSYKLVTKGKPVSFCLDYLPPKAPGEEPLTEPFMRTLAGDTEMKVLFTLEKSNYTATVPAEYGKEAYHLLRLEADGKNNYRLLHDGAIAGTFTSTRRPQKFWVGSYPPSGTSAGMWPRLSLDHVAAGPL